MNIPVSIVQEYAQAKADTLLLDILKMIGEEAYNAWLDEIYGDNATMPTDELISLATEKHDELISAECDHVLPEQVCSVCAPHTTDEIPF